MTKQFYLETLKVSLVAVFHTTDITSRFLSNKIMQYTEVTKNRYTRLDTNTEPLAREYHKNTQRLNHKNLTVKKCSFSVKQTYPQIGASSEGIVLCTCHIDRALETKCFHNY